MNKKIEEQRFEFGLYINGKIICQRYLHIPNFNEDAINSHQLDELMNSIAGLDNNGYGSFGIIPNHLKNQAKAHLWDNYNPYSENNESSYKNNNEKDDSFEFHIMVDKEIIAKKSFSANIFPPKIKYQVDIKSIIPVIVAEIRYFLSLKNYSETLA